MCLPIHCQASCPLSNSDHIPEISSFFGIGAALVLISVGSIQAADAIDAPVRQPHLKSWSNIIPNAAKRFIVLADFNNQAVLDRETGLVWEQTPDATDRLWTDAASYCLNKNVGGRKSWRLPSIPELVSLVDPAVAPGPTLPVGHPFTNVQSSQPKGYWSSTRYATSSYLV